MRSVLTYKSITLLKINLYFPWLLSLFDFTVQERTCNRICNNLFQLTEDTILDKTLYYNFALEIVLNEGNETTGTTAHAACSTLLE